MRKRSRLAEVGTHVHFVSVNTVSDCHVMSPCFQGVMEPEDGSVESAMDAPKISSDPGVPLRGAPSEGLTEMPGSQESSGTSKDTSSLLSVATDRDPSVAR